MSIFDKFQQLAAARQELEESCDTFFNIVMEEILSGTEAVVNGRPTILAGSNNYLGLSFDPDCVDAACKAVRKEGQRGRCWRFDALAARTSAPLKNVAQARA